MKLVGLTTLCIVFISFPSSLIMSQSYAQSTNSILRQRIVGYYASWNAGVLPYTKVEYSNLTDIIVAFGTPNSDGSVSYSSGIPFAGMVSDAHAAGVKVLISLGGAGSGAAFSTATQDSSLRSTLVSNIVNFLKSNDYDGVDIDWETPSNATETDQLTALVEELRTVFDAMDSAWLITMAIPADNYGGQHFDVRSLVGAVDWFNIMCYDFVGSWSAYSGFDSPLYQVASDPNQAGSDSTAISYWLSRGSRQTTIPRNRLVLGLPFYGDQFNAAGPFQLLTSTSVSNTRYANILSNLNSGWSYHWYDPAKVPYLLNQSDTQFVTYEDTNSVKLKTKFALANGLGGIMIWELSQDVTSTGSQPLLETIAATMRGVTPVVRKPALATDFALFDNYPNPFNPTTNIEYWISYPGFVSLKVYDVIGREVATLVNYRQSPGSYTVTFNGDKLPSGVYFYRMTVNEAGQAAPENRTATREMMLLK